VYFMPVKINNKKTWEYQSLAWRQDAAAGAE